MKAYCDKEKIDKLLDGRTKKWLSNKMNEYGVKIDYNTFLPNLNNKTEWKLTYALVIAKIFNVKVEDIFYLE